jgi:hypothetical protein
MEVGVMQISVLDAKQNMLAVSSIPILSRGSLRFFAALVALVNANAGALTAHLGNAVVLAALGANRTLRPDARF